MSQASAAVLFDVNNKKVLYSKNAHERLYPASLTKVMTALVALQNASPDTVLTATDSVKITESGAQLCGLKAGDTMTLDQALHILLIHMTSYQTAYYDKDGKAKELTVNNTNRFLRGDFQAPENITVIGGKTGTTNAAGHCLILLSRDTSGAPYISVILNSSASDVLYPEMVQLLEQINK